MSRYRIQRNGYEYERSEKVDWIDALAAKMEPTNAVEQARQRNSTDRSFLDQISAIMSRQNSHSSVEAKVQDYQDKIGLKEYLRRVSSREEECRKIAQDILEKNKADDSERATHELPKSFDQFTDAVKSNIVNFIRNKCETHHGNIQVPALVEEVSRMFRNVGVKPEHINEQEFEKYINDEIIECKKRNPTTHENNVNIGLGVGTDSNDTAQQGGDVFEALESHK